MELTNSLRKAVASLDKAKCRRELGWFKAEGTKCVLDTIAHFDVVALLATDAWLSSHRLDIAPGCVVKVTRADMDRMTHLSTAPEVIAVYRIPDSRLSADSLRHGLTLALDGVQDPGNLGTIIRCADWFGIDNIICSHDTVDLYNPKVVMSTMGAISRVRVHYCDLPAMLEALGDIPVYGTFLNGSNIYASSLPACAVVVMGNEGKGISPEVERVINRRITIPSFRGGDDGSESLNVAMATAIVISEFKRSNSYGKN